VAMLKSITTFTKSSIASLNSAQLKACNDLGRAITGVWKVNGDIRVVQVDNKDYPMYYWNEDKWVSFTPLALTPTDSIKRTDES